MSTLHKVGAKFEVTEQHLVLARHMYVGWQNCEFGAPEIDPKRPYGNSDVEDDICKILGIEVPRCQHCDMPLGDQGAVGFDARALHEEMQTVVEIVLSRAGIETEPGWYIVENVAGGRGRRVWATTAPPSEAPAVEA